MLRCVLEIGLDSVRPEWKSSCGVPLMPSDVTPWLTALRAYSMVACERKSIL